MGEYFLAPAARDDLTSIAEYVREAAGEYIAAELIRRIRAKCSLLADTSGKIGQARDEIGDEIRSFPSAPYVLFFTYRDESVFVLRVLHQRRDIDSELLDTRSRS